MPSQPDDPGAPWDEVLERLRRATAGEFEIGRELGRGGMAAVFLAHERSLARQVAIKVMAPGLMMGRGMVERFRREAITIARLNHPHIVSVHSVRQGEGLHFFVMRYVRGRSLDQVIRRAGRLSIPVARSILWQVGSALAYAHRAGIIHRDIKPANILVDQDGNAVVTDFGLAKAAELPGQTLSGVLVGTPAYMSPEQCDGLEASGASDQYALGVVAYEMVTGVAPFGGSSLTVMQAHVGHPVPPIREHCAGCPPDLEAAILRMLAKDPAARWPGMAEAMAALGAAPLADDDPLKAELGRLAAAGLDAGDIAGAADAVAVGGDISILPPPPDLEAGDSFALVAMVRGPHGTGMPPQAVHWSSDAPEILSVDSARAEATALAPGSALLTATCQGVRATLRVAIAAPKADEIVLQPVRQPVRVGGQIRLEATPRDKRGQPVARPVTWRSADPGVATVSPAGVLAGLAPGSARITAALDDAAESVVIPILPGWVAEPPPAALPAAPPRPLRRTARGGRRRPRGITLLTASLGAILAGEALWLALRSGETNTPWSGTVTAAHSDPPAAVAERAESTDLASAGGAAISPGTTDSDAGEAATSVGGAPAPVVAARRAPRPERGRPAERRESTVTAPQPASAESTTRAVAESTTRAASLTPPPAPVGVGTSAALDSGGGAADAAADATADSQPTAAGEVEESVTLQPQPEPGAEQLDEIEARRAAAFAAELRAAERRRLENQIMSGVGQCYGALRAKDTARLAAMYRPAGKSDADKLKKLSRILRADEWEAEVGQRVDGRREIGADLAAMEFSFELTWKDAFGGRLSSRPVFRAEFARNGGRWEMSSCRIVGSPKL